MKTIPCCDKTYKRAYLELILRSLRQYKKTKSLEFEFSPEDHKVIEYHLKDVARESVYQDISPEECAALFVARLERLIESQKSEWERVRELIHNFRISTPEEIIEFDELSHHFFKQKQNK